MKHVYFITGFPGFLAEQLLIQLYKDYPKQINHVYLLTLPSTKSQAQNRLNFFTRDNNLNESNFTLIEGDITAPGLDMSVSEDVTTNITHVFHLAAVYDLAVPKELAYRVNVDGTKNVNDWVETLPNLKRYIYFSTAYVAGMRQGRVYETELIHDAPFKNYYEETKYLAEIDVEALKMKIPTTIIRPSVVKGHSQTGYTTKFDGLYFFLNFFDKLQFSPIIPMIDNSQVEGNFVPSDYVIEATSFLAINDIGINKTYHLADPNPYTMSQLYQMLMAEYLDRQPKLQVPSSLTKKTLELARLRKWIKVEKEAIDYFIYDTSYDTTLAERDLLTGNITCPDLKDTLPSMIEFYRKYKDDSTKHIEIN